MLSVTVWATRDIITIMKTKIVRRVFDRKLVHLARACGLPEIEAIVNEFGVSNIESIVIEIEVVSTSRHTAALN